MLWPDRDANPFFHFFECLWMLNGQNDVAWINKYSEGIARYSDNGKTFHGAYGHRWRRHFKKDQLTLSVDGLMKDRTNRRVYVQMWDADVDLGEAGKDFPCNVGLTLQINVKGELDMVVHNRSNDLIWGALGANAVHFSFFQEVVAAFIGVPVGRYWQVSSNLHAYVEVLDKVRHIGDQAMDPYTKQPQDPYSLGLCTTYPVCSVSPVEWLQDLAIFMKEGPIIGFREPFFRQVATPLLRAHQAYKNRDNPDRFAQAGEILLQCRAEDWRLACQQWLERRKARALKAMDDGVHP